MRELNTFNPNLPVRDLDRLFNSFWSGHFGNHQFSHSTTVPLPVDVFETNGVITVQASVPGVNPADLNLELENSILTISGEFKNELGAEDSSFYRQERVYGAFSRSIRLPKEIQGEKITANFANGVVTVMIPRSETLKPRAIKINVIQGQPTPQISESSAPAGSMSSSELLNSTASETGAAPAEGENA